MFIWYCPWGSRLTIPPNRFDLARKVARTENLLNTIIIKVIQIDYGGEFFHYDLQQNFSEKWITQSFSTPHTSE